jgi:hypothetical protein
VIGQNLQAGPEACVIERTQRAAAVRPIPGPVLVQANHHGAGRFAGTNEELRAVVEGEEEFSLAGSGCRADTLAGALAELPLPWTLGRAAEVLSTPTVLNKLTCQQMAEAEPGPAAARPCD